MGIAFVCVVACIRGGGDCSVRCIFGCARLDRNLGSSFSQCNVCTFSSHLEDVNQVPFFSACCNRVCQPV